MTMERAERALRATKEAQDQERANILKASREGRGSDIPLNPIADLDYLAGLDVYKNDTEKQSAIMHAKLILEHAGLGVSETNVPQLGFRFSNFKEIPPSIDALTAQRRKRVPRKVSVSEAVQILNVSGNTIRKYIKSAEIPTSGAGVKGNPFKVDLAQLRRILNSRE